MTTPALGSTLRRLRKQHGLTQDHVAARLGISRTTYTHYETGRYQPDITTLVTLASLYGVSIDAMLGRPTETAPPVGSPDVIFAHGLGDLSDDERAMIEEVVGTLIKQSRERRRKARSRKIDKP